MGLDEACAPEDGLICEDSLICSSGNVCAQSSVVGEGERCSRDGVRMCESNFACEFIGQLGPFCLPIETLPEGAICDPSDPLALCETDFVCLSENGGVPRCVALSPACRRIGRSFHWTNSLCTQQQPIQTIAVFALFVGVTVLGVCRFSVLLPQGLEIGCFRQVPHWGSQISTRCLKSEITVPGGSSVSECDDDSGPGMYSEVRRELGAQETVYLVVGGFAGRAGTFSIRAVEVEP